MPYLLICLAVGELQHCVGQAPLLGGEESDAAHGYLDGEKEMLRVLLHAAVPPPAQLLPHLISGRPAAACLHVRGHVRLRE